jgi:hypothetical protein
MEERIWSFGYQSGYRRIEGIPDNKQILRKNLLGVFPSYKGTDIIKVLRKVWETGIPQKSSLVFNEGEEIKGWREYYVYRLSTNEIVAIFDDLTEKKKAEREQKILRATVPLSEMESIGALAGGIAHNFRTSYKPYRKHRISRDDQQRKREIKEITSNILILSKRRGPYQQYPTILMKGQEYKIVEVDLAMSLRNLRIISRVFNRNIDIQ